MSTAIANQLFLVYLGRPADTAWRTSTADLLNGSQPSAALQTAFYNAAISEGVFSATDSSSTLVNKIFLQTFGFGASTFEQTAWGSLVTNGTVSKETLAWTIFKSYLGATNVPDVYKVPAQSKLLATDSYTNALLNDANANLALSQGSGAATLARSYAASVTSQATAATAIANVTASVASLATAQTGSTFTLTTGVDSGTAFTGTGNNDIFNALTTTLGTGDNVNGGAGTDSLNVMGTLSANGTIAGFTLSSIENVNVSLADGDIGNPHTLTLNMANAGAAQVSVSGLSASTHADTVALTNLAAGSSLAMTNATDLNLTANFVTAATAGTADTVSVALNTVASTAATDGILTIGAGFETLNIATSGAASTLGDVIFGGTRINVTGSQNLTVTSTLDASVKTIDASAFTGKLSVVTANNTTDQDATVAGVDQADLTITGGSGADTINISDNAADNEVNVNAGNGDDLVIIGQILSNASTGSVGDVLVGGAGTDTLAGDIDLFDAVTAGFTGTTKLTGVSGFEILKVNGFGAEDNTLNVSNISADITTVTVASEVDANGGHGLTVNFGTAGAYTVNIGGEAHILAADTLTVDADGTATTDSLTIANTNAATGTNQIGSNGTAIVVTDFETVTLNTGSYSTATAQLVNTVNVGANTLVLTGSNGLTTTATTGIITATVINASGMTGALTMGAAAASGLTSITGGSGADVLIGDASSTISGGNGNDSITGGADNDVLNGDAGNDTITTGAGSDKVDGGDGDDTLVFAGNLSAGDTIAGGAGTDTISLTNASLAVLKGLTMTEANTFNTNFTSIETLKVTDPLDETTFDLGYLNSLTSVRLDAGITGPEALNGFDSGESLDLRAALSEVLTVGVNSAATGTTDSFTVKLGGSPAGAATGIDYTTVAIANVETLTIVNSEATANAAIRDNVVALTLSQATGGAAQSVIITGTESLTLHNATAAGTINASGMTVVAATDLGLTMDAAFTATTAITGQTITGSDKVDALRSSTGTDTINAGAGNDTIYGSKGADVIDGGAGTDTYVTATTMIAASIEGAGSGTSTGLVINLGSAALTNTNVLGTAGQDLSGGLTSVTTGQVAYLFNGSVPTNSTVVKTLSNIENITLAGDGINYVVGSEGANVITGGAGVDTINAGAGNDTVIITGTSQADKITLGAGADLVVLKGADLGALDHISTGTTAIVRPCGRI